MSACRPVRIPLGSPEPFSRSGPRPTNPFGPAVSAQRRAHPPGGLAQAGRGLPRGAADLARRAAVDGLVQRSICGHLTEEMTERYSSVAQAEVQAALGKVVSLAGYRGLLRKAGGAKRSGGKVVGKAIAT